MKKIFFKKKGGVPKRGDQIKKGGWYFFPILYKFFHQLSFINMKLSNSSLFISIFLSQVYILRVFLVYFWQFSANFAPAVQCHFGRDVWGMADFSKGGDSKKRGGSNIKGGIRPLCPLWARNFSGLAKLLSFYTFHGNKLLQMPL